MNLIQCGTYSSQNCRKMFREVSRVLKTKGYYICISYGDIDIRRTYFEHPEYEWSILPPSPYKVFKPNISQADVEFDDKDKERNKDYYHYVYILQKVRLELPVACGQSFTARIPNQDVKRSYQAVMSDVKAPL